MFSATGSNRIQINHFDNSDKVDFMSRRRKIEQSKDYFKTNDMPSFYKPKIRHHQPKTYWDM